VALTLYLDNTATASPFPTTSKKLVTSAPASEVQLGPGEFDSGLPGTTDAGQWNPSSAIGDTTAAAEIDNTGASLGTARQGWLYDTDLTGYTLPSGTLTVQLRLRANQGTGTAGRVCVRMTVVTGSAGAWTTVANLLTTAITGEASHSAGQEGWRANEGARITVTSTAANFAATIATAFAAHTFASGERLLIEFGFCDANSTADRTWRLDYNTSNTFVTLPDLALAGIDGDIASTQAAQTESIAGGVTAGAAAASTQAAQTSAVAAAAVVGGAMASADAAQVSALDGTVGDSGVEGDLASVNAAQTSALTGGVAVSGALASVNAAQTDSAAGAVLVGAGLASTQAAQTSSLTAAAIVGAGLVCTVAAQTESIAAGVLVGGALASTAAPQVDAGAVAVLVGGALDSAGAAQTSTIAAGLVAGGALASTQAAQTSELEAAAIVGGSLACVQPQPANADLQHQRRVLPNHLRRPGELPACADVGAVRHERHASSRAASGRPPRPPGGQAGQRRCGQRALPDGRFAMKGFP
jgi:hypothetical protein